MKTLDDVKLKGKKVLIRVDINASIIDGKVQKSPRFRRHSATIKEISKRGAKVVILAHQKRRDNPEYRESLEEHAKILSELTKRDILYINDLFGKRGRRKRITLFCLRNNRRSEPPAPF